MRHLILAIVLSAPALASAQSPDHHAQMLARGAHAMGFDQARTTHHFYLYEDGGAIQVTVNDVKDAENLAAIRSHLPHLVTMFGSGDFSMPGFIHDRPVPGSAVMAQNKDHIAYVYEEMPGGGRVRVITRFAPALQGVHEFMRFQITDHKTGDSLEVTRRP
jgi:hypothetical protein